MPTPRRDARVVAVVVAVSIAATVASVALLPQTSPSAGCRAHEPGTPLPYLTPADPVLLPNGTSYLVGEGIGLHFCIDASVEFDGAWSAAAPVAVAVFPIGNGATTWPFPGSFSSTGNFSEVLFPGTYVLVVLPGLNATSTLALEVTRAVHAQFDRGLDLLQPEMSFELASNAFLAWPISGVPTEPGAWFNGSFDTTSCHDELAVLPADVFGQFPSDRAVINGTGTLLISGMSLSPCTSPRMPQPLGLYTWGPFALAPGEVLVYWNMGPTAADLEITSPLQLSFPEL